MRAALIPVRRGSVRVKNKNVRFLGGEPLLHYSIKAALASSLIGEVVVSTDAKLYAEYAELAGAQTLFRPKEISTGNTPDLPVVEHFLKYYPHVTDIVYLRPTTPTRNKIVLNKAINFFEDNRKEYDSLRSIEEMSESCYKCFELEGHKLKTLCGQAVKDTNHPNHFYPSTFKANGYIDILKAETIWTGSMYGDNIYGFETQPVIEIDTEREFELLEMEIQQKGAAYVFK